MFHEFCTLFFVSHLGSLRYLRKNSLWQHAIAESGQLLPRRSLSWVLRDSWIRTLLFLLLLPNIAAIIIAASVAVVISGFNDKNMLYH